MSRSSVVLESLSALLLVSCGATSLPESGSDTDHRPTVDERFAAFIDRLSSLEGGVRANAPRYEGRSVQWTLHSMGYEESGTPLKGGRFRWRERMRLFAGELPPRSDLGAVLASRWPVIVAVVPGQGQGYDGWEWGDRVRVEGVIRGLGEHDVLFLDNYSITRDLGDGPVTRSDAHLEPAPGIDLQLTEEQAARALARHHKARLDGTTPPESWPERITKVGDRWVVDVDTSNLPGDYPEKIIITVEDSSQ